MKTKEDMDTDNEKKEDAHRNARVSAMRSKGMSERDAVLTSMKREKVERDDIPSSVEPASEEYAYGLRINLGNEELEKLEITSLPEVGSTVTITAEAEVVSVSATTHQSTANSDAKEQRDVSLQIQSMSIT